ncbi:hypothetical protein MASR1M50_14070 [Burkholderiales bacterium]
MVTLSCDLPNACAARAARRFIPQNTTRMTPPEPMPDPTRCPLCGQPNRCAQALARATGQPAPPCWCMQQRVDPRQLARVPARARGQACLCPACAGPAA